MNKLAHAVWPWCMLNKLYIVLFHSTEKLGIWWGKCCVNVRSYNPRYGREGLVNCTVFELLCDESFVFFFDHILEL